jgi:hypothetical protein
VLIILIYIKQQGRQTTHCAKKKTKPTRRSYISIQLKKVLK